MKNGLRGYGSKSTIWLLVGSVLATKYGIDVEMLRDLILAFLSNPSFEAFVIGAGTLLHYLRDRVKEAPDYRANRVKPSLNQVEPKPIKQSPAEFFGEDRTL